MFVFVLIASFSCLAQDQTQSGDDATAQPNQTQADNRSATVTIPAGTRLALVLPHPIQSRYIHHGDDVYAQVTSPVNTGNEVVIPPGTFVQGTVDKLGRSGGRGAAVGRASCSGAAHHAMSSGAATARYAG